MRDTFEVPDFATGAAMRLAGADDRSCAILRALDAAKARRSIFAPAESVNALTIAAAHADGSQVPLAPHLADPFTGLSAPNIASGLGHGFNRSVKPDVMLAGGRQVAHPTEGPILKVHGRESTSHFGQRVASPDHHGASLTKEHLSSGTSNAAALATRAGLLIGDVLDASPLIGAEPWYRRATAPCILKALIAHGAAWGDVGRAMTAIHAGAGSLRTGKEAVSRAIGYGPIELERLVAEQGHRVTLLGEDLVRVGKRHGWRIPLPDELSASADFRRIVVTLAWLTPIEAHRLCCRTRPEAEAPLIPVGVMQRGSSRVYRGE